LESNVLYITSPVTIVGDLHGHFFDLLEMFRVTAPPPDAKYLFLGNFVNRGEFSVETISLLACLKLRYRDRIHLLRGNHEERSMTQMYGFYEECLKKYGTPEVWKSFTDLFDYFTISAVIDQKIFCVHGGVTDKIKNLDQIRVCERFRKSSTASPLINGLLWSDPITDPTFAESPVTPTSPRGMGSYFNKSTVANFLTTNGLTEMVRGHQLVMEGHDTIFDGKVSTLWSAPNYCGVVGNLASVLEIYDNSYAKMFNVFEAAPLSERTNSHFSPYLCVEMDSFFADV